MNRAPTDAAGFIRANLRLLPVPAFPEFVLYTPHPGSGLRRLEKEGAARNPPYWPYVWAGGAALARFVLDRPDLVAGRRVLDLGCGSGIVALAAARAGAATVSATDIDPYARTAATLNADANGLAVEVLEDPPSEVDIVLAGDVFYDARATRRSISVLDGFRFRGIPVLVGDPGRATLPLHLLTRLADIMVHDFGAAPDATPIAAAVYLYRSGPCPPLGR